jgi:hypothetical protein
MMGVGFAFMTPVLLLIGYQFLWSSWTLVRAGAMEAFGRLILSIMAVAVSSALVAMLIDVVNAFNIGIIHLHMSLGYPAIQINGQEMSLDLTKQGENDPMSFRGVVVPMSRWGCIGNDFVAILSTKFWTDAAQFAPFVGGIAKFVGNIFDMLDFAKHVGEFVVLVMSITLCVQVVMRLILINYYVVTAPVVFACWAVPTGGMGQIVVRQWAKGLLSLLFTQTLQLFVLTTFPAILPPFPQIPVDLKFGIINTIIAQVPRVIVLVGAVQVPKIMGTRATQAVAQAGTVVGGIIVAGGAAAMNTV